MVKIPKLPLLLTVLFLTMMISAQAINYNSTALSGTFASDSDIEWDGNRYYLNTFTGGSRQIYSYNTTWGDSTAEKSGLGNQNRMVYVGEGFNKWDDEVWLLYDWNTATLHGYNASFTWTGSKTVTGSGDCDVTRNSKTDRIYISCLNGAIYQYSPALTLEDVINNTYDVVGSNHMTWSGNEYVMIKDLNTTHLSFETWDENWDLVNNESVAIATGGMDWRGAGYSNSQVLLSEFNTPKVEIFDYDYINPNSITVGNISFSKTLCIEGVGTVPYTFDTVHGVFESTTGTSESFYCTNTTSIYDSVTGQLQFYCGSLDDVEYCSDTCVNTLVNNTYYGTCTQLGCQNECNILGAQSCTSGTTYGICGNYDSDACLEFGSPLFCPANQYCSETSAGGQCGTITTNEYYNQDFLTVDLEMTSQTGVISEEGTSEVTKDFVDVGIYATLPILLLAKNTIDTFILDVFFYNDQVNETYLEGVFNDDSGGSENYYAYDCNYEATLFQSDFLDHNNLLANGWVGSGTINNSGSHVFVNTTSELNKTLDQENNAVYETIIEMRESGNYTLTFYSGSTTLLTYEIVNNKTSYNTYMIELGDNKTIFNSTSTSDDLQEIYIRTNFIEDISSANVEISLVREVLGEDINENYYSYPFITSTLQADKLSYNGNGNILWVYQISGTSVSDYPTYTYDNNSGKTFTCNHEINDCYTVRAYGNEQGMSTYHFYEQIKVCANAGALGDEPVVTEAEELTDLEKVLGVEWSDNQKLLIAGLIILIIFGIFAGLSYVEKDGTFVLIGTIISGIFMFYFIIAGFIPAWIIVLFGLIGASIGAVAIRSMVLGRD